MARALAAAGAIALGVLLWGGYVRHWAWTGFGDNDTLWDWLELALLPTAVATLPLWLRHRPLVHRRGRIGLATAAAIFAVLVLAGYLVPLRWTGFRGNTLWDWLNLVALPIVLVFLGPWTDVAARVRDHPRRHLLALAVAAFVALAVAGYAIPMLWTGFPGNTLWDWLQLLLLPLLVPTVLGPALLRWIAVEESRPAPAAVAGTPAGLAPVGRGAIAFGAAAGILALSLGVALGAAALGGDDDGAPSRAAAGTPGPCAAPAARTLAADTAGRVVRAGAGVFACSPGGRARRLGPATGAARPVALRLAAGRVVYGLEGCGGRGCSVAVRVLRLSDGRAFVRARFTHSAPLAGLTVSPRGALAVMLAGSCAGCSPARVVLIDARGTRVADSGRALDTGSLAEAGTTVFWRHGGRAVSAQLSG
jgi:hypothetical protein